MRTDWSPLKWAMFLPFTLIIAIGLVVMVAHGAGKKAPPKPPPPEKILFVGDSLSVGKFGEVMGDYLIRKYGRENVALYASCGSSPENWLRDEPVYRTKCGYREMVPHRPLVMGDPMRHDTPKLEKLLEDFNPSIIFVQQGTNWMDRPLTDEKILSILDRFMGAVLKGGKRRILWIGPPDSSRFHNVQGRIYQLIKKAKRPGVSVVDSRRQDRRYVIGKTGGDGIHYNSESSTLWADWVIRQLK